jgi:hypothetical protein
MITRRACLQQMAGAVVMGGAVAHAAPRTISGVLDVPASELNGGAIDRWIEGDGHVHRVQVRGLDLETLLSAGRVVVRSGPGDSDGHRHWIAVQVR